jgi:Na+-transporting methylmalonyl-CoA/oxaloacetate decarboxylase gamma subunit
VTPGFLGFGVVVILGVALFFLLRSMNKQISRIEAPKEADLKQAEWERANPVPADDEDVEASATAASAAEPNGKTD